MNEVYQYPTDWHEETNEDGKEYNHPGYDIHCCSQCLKAYPVAKNVGAFLSSCGEHREGC